MNNDPADKSGIMSRLMSVIRGGRSILEGAEYENGSSSDAAGLYENMDETSLESFNKQLDVLIEIVKKILDAKYVQGTSEELQKQLHSKVKELEVLKIGITSVNTNIQSLNESINAIQKTNDDFKETLAELKNEEERVMSQLRLANENRRSRVNLGKIPVLVRPGPRRSSVATIETRFGTVRSTPPVLLPPNSFPTVNETRDMPIFGPVSGLHDRPHYVRDRIQLRRKNAARQRQQQQQRQTNANNNDGVVLVLSSTSESSNDTDQTYQEEDGEDEEDERDSDSTNSNISEWSTH